MQEPEWKPRSPLVATADLPRLCALHRAVVLHCGAVWTDYDVRMDERLQPLREEFSPDLGVYAMDVDDAANATFLRANVVLNLPALVCLAGSEHRETLIGLREQSELRAKMRAWLEEAEAAPGA